MNDQQDNLRNFEEFLAARDDLSPETLKGELRAEGVPVDSFLLRIRAAVREASGNTASTPLTKVEQLSMQELENLLGEMIAGNFGSDFQQAALTEFESRESISEGEMRQRLAELAKQRNQERDQERR